MKASTDTIAAIATAAGRAGVGVVRVSGALVPAMAEALLGKLPPVRLATRAHFRDADGSAIDDGLALYFAAPKSFTGEPVLELQGHGGPVVLDRLLRRCLQLGARVARPGEFSERAFLNDKLDLAQAEAIADLIDASSETAARLAMRSLSGEFSARVHALVEALIRLRIYVEAAIDFPEEEIDFLSDGKVASDVQQLQTDLAELLNASRQGQVLREGIKVVIAGKPNAGKSSLLNALSGRDAAIVTAIAGTTRDVLRELITVDGLPIHLIDTAGLRDSADPVEQIGIERAQREMRDADALLLVVDSSDSRETDPEKLWPLASPLPVSRDKITVLHNKSDLSGERVGIHPEHGAQVIALSAQTGAGMTMLRERLKQLAGLTAPAEGLFMARRRHLDALEQAQALIQHGAQQLRDFRAGELLAEDLRLAQQQLNSITGEFSADDLLGRIFSSFCIGK
ncbi:tRNA uridine-5-carboxymethylaminomethyl(34) synthesis GTPase MnmE [Permianibacter sp. IMCC34836]|uniref:tRNA uridine-5-carboxymethylaminomethyl(34) synthesis GTPase MnmE n=1 Tax=Permianibacter fluminis TaxID=2738515 RepID=UPI0015550F85|nr:tRNA uridine-5-carboxymethylaminomethyl(34) synthesis GTPase MnmE [Permianibacter fluminis]NQD36027.1 tRNA uridine-5-carboxymethylaminomethyl(34) synthesis GTPase MnmE [Permianibacter fluminis]